MILERNETPQELAFTLTLPQLRQAHEIYKKHCFFQDFIECCEERRTEETGLCNLPYQTLEHETDILCKAYELYEKQADINVSYRYYEYRLSEATGSDKISSPYPVLYTQQLPQENLVLP